MAGFYRLVRVQPNGTERIIRDVPFADVTDEQLQRAEAFAAANQSRLDGRQYRLYSSDDNGVVIVPDDCIWDSAVNL